MFPRRSKHANANQSRKNVEEYVLHFGILKLGRSIPCDSSLEGVSNMVRPIQDSRRLLFVGSGFSTSLGMPSWTSIFRQIAKESLDLSGASTINHMLSVPGHEYQAADTLCDLLGNRATLEAKTIALIRDEQARIVGRQDLHNFTSPIRGLGSSGIITTNWDMLLPAITNFKPLIWPRDIVGLTEALRLGIGFVLYLHGNIENPPLVITTRDSKQQAMTLDAARFKLDAMLAAYLMTVIGFGFPDDYINDMLSAASLIAGDSKRVRVVLYKVGDKPEFPIAHPKVASGSILQAYEAYEDFRHVLVAMAGEYDRSGEIAGIPDLNPSDTSGLFDIVSHQKYSFDSIHAIRKEFDSSDRSMQLYESSANLILEAKDLAGNEAGGLLATLLSTAWRRWRPKPSTLDALEDLCSRTIGDDPKMVGVFEPLVFALATHGRPRQHGNYIRTVLKNTLWRAADVSRVEDYYQSQSAQVSALARHLKIVGGLAFLQPTTSHDS